MTKMTKEYHKILPDESVSLLKDKKTKRLNWRHRYVVKKRNNIPGKQYFKDYPYTKFKTLLEFEQWIEDLPKEKRYKLPKT